MPILAHTGSQLAAALHPSRPGDLALVMTMGALHDGHAALIRAARQRAATVVVSIFVNNLQFAPTEDINRYPRTLDADLQVCEREGADIVFAPSVAEVYPTGESYVRVVPGPVGGIHEGALRPAFLPGVLTVVAKFFHLVRPDLAFFGEKDAQQLVAVRRMVTDLDFPVEIVAVPAVREPDGLVKASRNVYLSPAERRTALTMSKSLMAGKAEASNGPQAVLKATRDVLDRGARLDPPLLVKSLVLVDEATFEEVPDQFTGGAILALAAGVGDTHLVDSVPLAIRGAAGREPRSAVRRQSPMPAARAFPASQALEA
ncbi:pantoate--beta-alanine ligase [Streptomyces sp. 7N604]|uniref:pantoate--beta-alanine ligase n=1 Tax=Streptomyces sp. 7N604 TaxID=3457415 RepID=UPI003FD4D1A0